MSSYRENMTFACTKPQKDQLNQRAKDLGIPRAVLLREIVSAYFEGRSVRPAAELKREHERMLVAEAHSGKAAGIRARKPKQPERDPNHPWRNTRILGKATRGEV